MQSPDVNVLVSAFREDAPHHGRCRAWLVEALSGREQVGLSELVLSGVLRVLELPRFGGRICSEPACQIIRSIIILNYLRK